MPTPLPPTAPAPHRAWWRRPGPWLLLAVAGPLLALLLLVLALALFGAQWLRTPLQNLVQQQTGRALQIDGSLQLGLGWPLLRLQAQDLRFANPAWARQPQMLQLDSADLQLDLRALLRGRLLLATVALGQPQVALEVAPDGRKSWLLDRAQRDAGSALQIGRLTLRQGRVDYEDTTHQTRLQLQLDTAGPQHHGPSPGPTSPLGARSDLLFNASGQLRGQPLQATGRGGPVLGLGDQGQPYPLLLEAGIGSTRLRAEGRISGLATLAAVDLQLALRGDNLAALSTLLGLALPDTGGFAGSGQLRRQGSSWRYQGFSGQLGRSDVAGHLALDLAGTRPLLQGEIRSRQLDLADLAQLAGLPGLVGAAATPGPATAAPDPALVRTQWRSLDADLQLQAQQVLRAHGLPLDSAAARLRLQDGLLTLDAIDLAGAGGRLGGSLRLDMRQPLPQASAQLQARGLQLGALFPAADKATASSGRLHARVDLRGQGRSLAAVLATADGQLQLVAEPGRISRLLVARLGLDLLQLLQLGLSTDQTVSLRCVVADFSAERGVLRSRALALDTAVSTVVGSGEVDLAQQTLDFNLLPRSRRTSLVAQRGPLRVHGPLAAPQLSLDTPGIVARGAGALALGLVNPLLALLPLVETAKNSPSHCSRTVAALGLSAAPEAGAGAASAPRAAPAAPRNGTRAGTAPPAPGPSRP